jgi:ATP phosphoribosyltransferase regulatory subunit
MPAWLLPESISDILPAEARRIEELRRSLLDLFRTYGYELVMPPLLEYTESLLSGTGRDMDLQMFKLVDQISGRTMGLRADITPQVARIDAHLLNRQGVTRLCYAGSVVHTRPQALSATREPLQVGAEIYGHAGMEADLEVQELLLASLKCVGIPEVRLDLGHAEVLRAILAVDPAGFVVAEQVYALLQAKDREGLIQLKGLQAETSRALIQLCELYGGAEVIERARRMLPQLPRIGAALDGLARLVSDLEVAEVTIDLADIRGYYYHSGVMFSAYCPGLPSAIARGGRYDEVGEAFGRARPAAGFSLYLRDLAPLLPQLAVPAAIRAPWSHDSALRATIAALRADGQIVVQSLPGHEHELEEFRCDRILVQHGTSWNIEPLSPPSP